MEKGKIGRRRPVCVNDIKKQKFCINRNEVKLI